MQTLTKAFLLKQWISECILKLPSLCIFLKHKRATGVGWGCRKSKARSREWDLGCRFHQERGQTHLELQIALLRGHYCFHTVGIYKRINILVFYYRWKRGGKKRARKIAGAYTRRRTTLGLPSNKSAGEFSFTLFPQLLFSHGWKPVINFPPPPSSSPERLILLWTNRTAQ